MFYVVLIYGMIVLVGGVLGYALRGSLPSLIMGLSCGLLLLWGAWGIRQKKKWGLPLSLLTTLALDLSFTHRFFQTQKFFPSGLLAFVSLLVLIILIQKFRKRSIK